MGTVSHIKGAAGAMRKLTERDIDAQIASNRERYDDAFDRFDRSEPLAVRRALSRPAVIQLDRSLLGRFARWLRSIQIRLIGPL